MSDKCSRNLSWRRGNWQAVHVFSVQLPTGFETLGELHAAACEGVYHLVVQVGMLGVEEYDHSTPSRVAHLRVEVPPKIRLEYINVYCTVRLAVKGSQMKSNHVC